MLLFKKFKKNLTFENISSIDTGYEISSNSKFNFVSKAFPYCRPPDNQLYNID